MHEWTVPMSRPLSLIARLLPALEDVPLLGHWVSRGIVDETEAQTTSRPLPYSCWTPGPAWTPNRPSDDTAEPYISWPSLFDRGYTARHLPPLDAASDPAPIGTLAADGTAEAGTLLALLERRTFQPCPRTSSLLCFFAQWFTDSFLRTDPADLRRNLSNHEIDLCQIYGPDEATTRMLREGAGGRLRTRMVGGQAYPDLLLGADGQPQPRYAAQPGYAAAILSLFEQTVTPPPGARVKLDAAQTTEGRRRAIYATGLPQGSSTIFYAAVSTILIREHNRIAALLATQHPRWDDDRLFETARNTVIALLLKLVVEEYISHISGLPQRLELNFAEYRSWYRANHIAIEFDLLYRWHAMVPDRILLDGESLPPSKFRFNNAALEAGGPAALLRAASIQPAGRLGLRNTPRFLLGVEQRSLQLSRMHRLQPYNAYRVCFGCKPVTSFEELTKDADLAAQLTSLYGEKVDQMDLTIGLLAEQRDDDEVMGNLMEVMVGLDAFSQVYTNPLLSAHVYGTAAFAEGLDVLQTTASFDDIVRRNGGGAGGAAVSFDYQPAAV
jgi:prostaglandin-endoperoxide synthase 2